MSAERHEQHSYHLERHQEAIERVCQGGFYSRYRLGGPRGVPAEPETYACIYPGANGSPEYWAFALDNGDGQLREKSRRQVAQLVTPERAHQSQGKLELFWGSQPARAPELLEAVASKLESAETPLAFVVLGRTADTGRQTAHIFHHPDMPTAFALELIKTTAPVARHDPNGA